MKCPECGGRLVVKDSRHTQDEVLRRRKCLSCGVFIYTYESIDESDYAKKMLSRTIQKQKEKTCSRKN